MTKTFLCNFSDSAEFTVGKKYSLVEGFTHLKMVNSDKGNKFFLPENGLLLISAKECARFEK